MASFPLGCDEVKMTTNQTKFASEIIHSSVGKDACQQVPKGAVDKAQALQKQRMEDCWERDCIEDDEVREALKTRDA